MLKKIFLLLIIMVTLFGCADDKNQSLQNPSDNNSTEDNNTSNQDEYFKAIISTISNIPVSDNVSQWGFEPYYTTDYLDVFIADKLGRPTINSNKIVDIHGGYSSDAYSPHYDFVIYEFKDSYKHVLHRMVFDLPPTSLSMSSMEHAIIDYYTKFIKTEPYKNTYHETIYIKKN